MKILQIVTQSVVGGAQSVVIELSNALSNDAHDIFVLSKDGGPMWDSLNEKISKIPCMHFVRNVSPINDLKSYFFIRKIIKQIKPDIIHLHTSKVGFLGRLAAWPFYTKKTFYTMHGFDAILRANRKFLPLEKICKICCNKIIAVSKYDEENLLKNGIKNTTVIYNAIADLKKLAQRDPSVEQRIRDYAKNKKIIMTVARVSKQKRFESFKELAEQMPEFCFIWIGNKEEMPDLPQNMHCLGEIPNAGSYIELADVFVLLTNYEGLPVSIIESFACGVPVVASRVGGIPEILHNQLGYALENEISLFKNKIQEILTDESIHNKLKTNARKEYEKAFTIEKMKDSYLKLFQSHL